MGHSVSLSGCPFVSPACQAMITHQCFPGSYAVNSEGPCGYVTVWCCKKEQTRGRISRGTGWWLGHQEAYPSPHTGQDSDRVKGEGFSIPCLLAGVLGHPSSPVMLTFL